MILAQTLTGATPLPKPTPPSTSDLYQTIIDHIHTGRWVDLSVYLAILYLPAVLVFVKAWWDTREVKKLYEKMLSQCRDEISRQATRIKELENALIKNVKRK